MLNFGSLSGFISTAYGLFGFNSGASSEGGNETQGGMLGQGVAIRLKFHEIHGSAIKLEKNSRVAKRDQHYFEHSVLFSHRPICVNESVAVQVKEITSEFNGPLRIGFISIDPYNFYGGTRDNYNDVPLGRDLKNMNGVWMKGIHLFPIDVGTTIYWKVNQDGSVLYGVDGVNGGVFLREVDTTTPLWAVVEAYGKVKAVQFVNKTMMLKEEDPTQTATSNVNQNPNPRTGSLIVSSVRGRLRLRPPRPNGQNTTSPSSLALRRDMRLPPLQNFNNILDSSTIKSPPVSAFFSPLPGDDLTHGLCLVCVDRAKDAAFIDCGHLCMCYECAKAFTFSQAIGGSLQLCPICRAAIISILKVYQ